MPGGGESAVRSDDHDDRATDHSGFLFENPARSSWNQATRSSPSRQHRNTRLPSRSAGKIDEPRLRVTQQDALVGERGEVGSQ